MPPQLLEEVDGYERPSTFQKYEEKIQEYIDNRKSTKKDAAQIKDEPLPPRKYKLIWINIIILTYVQLGAIFGLYITFTSAKLWTILFGLFFYQVTLLGVAAGAHRLWSHRSYKAKLPLRIILSLLHAAAFQEDVFTWVKNHRLHHKYPDDDADPYNPKRGFFFAHCGWLMVQRHPRSVEKGRRLDMFDMLSDAVVMFQKKHYFKMMLPLCFIFPTVAPMYFWGETFMNAWYINLLRYNACLHSALGINSVAHYFGWKPYDKRIGPCNNDIFNIISVGEGAHNYHHVFPWDYRSIEMNTFYFNLTTWFIDAMAKIGWAYDLKSASEEMVANRVRKTGIESHRPRKVTS